MKKIIKILLFLILIFLTNSCMVEYESRIQPNTYDYFRSPYYYFHGYPYYGYPYGGYPYHYYTPHYYYHYNPPKPNHSPSRPKPGTHYGPRR